MYFQRTQTNKTLIEYPFEHTVEAEIYYRGKVLFGGALYPAEPGCIFVDALSLDTDETRTKMAVTYEAVRR